MGHAHIRLVGVVGTVLAVVAYAIGTAVPYPGRELSLTVGMVAVTLLALGGVGGGRS